MMPFDPLLSVRPLGVRVTVNLSTVLVVALVSGGATAGLDRGPNERSMWVLGTVAAFVMFVSVVGLQIGSQMWASARLGTRIRHIHVLSFGGIVLPGRHDDSPRRELLFGLSGGVGLIPTLLVCGGLIAVVLENGDTPPGHEWYSAALVTSCGLAAIQLLPALGLSGGRAFRSLVWYLTDNAVTGAKAAAAYGYLIGAGLMGLGLGIIGLGGARPYWGIWAILAGWQLSGSARVEVYRTRWLSLATSRTLIETLQPATRIGSTASIDEAVEPILASGFDHPLLVVDAAGVAIGILRLDNLRAIRRSEWPRHRVSEIAPPIDGAPTISASAIVIDAMDLLDRHDADWLIVTSAEPPNHALTVLTRAALLRGVRKRPPAQRLRQG